MPTFTLSYQTRLRPWRRIAATVCAVVGAVLTLLALTAPVLACRSAANEERILLDAIPPAAEASEVIARVEIVEVYVRELPELRPFHVARARVLQSVRGIADGYVFEIFAEPTSCGGGLDKGAVGLKGFIAGRFYQYGGEPFFRGTWTNRQIGTF